MLGHLESNRAVDDVASVLLDAIGGWMGIEWRKIANQRISSPRRCMAHFDVRDGAKLCLILKDERTQRGYRNSVSD
jgi:hypothetical protein